MRQRPFLMIFTVLLCGWQLRAQDCADEAAWNRLQFLQGKWKIENRNSVEHWELRGNREMIGRVYSLSGKDTLISDVIQLLYDGKETWYAPKVMGQNDDNPVPFKLIVCTENMFVFENKTNEFPRKIGYRRIGDDKMLAWIEGIRNGAPHKSDFPMKRIR